MKRSELPDQVTDLESLEKRIEAALLEYHVVDPRRLEEVERMRTEMRALSALDDDGGAARMATLCINYIREGQAIRE